jgi:hypothetical protein
MANWRPIRIIDVLEEIEDRKIVLPVVQRDLVWKEGQIELLFDTLMRGDSFGGIMTIKDYRGKDPLFDYRYFISDYHQNAIISSSEHDKLGHDIYYVVDGQQRLSAFYIGLTGLYDNKALYFDLLGEYDRKNFNFKFSQGRNELKTEIDNFDGSRKRTTFWISVSDLLKRFKDAGSDVEIVLNNLLADFEQQIDTDDKRKYASGNLTRFQQEVFVSPNIGLCEVSINRNLDEGENKQNIVELFRRLNQGGTKLDAMDLMASKLKGFSSDNEYFLSSARNEFTDIGFNQDEIIKLIFILQDDHKKTVSDISNADSDFIQVNKDRVFASLKATRQFLRLSKLYQYYKELNPSIIPLYFIAYYAFHQSISDNDVEKYYDTPETNANFSKISKWIKISLLNKIFRRRGAGWTAYSTGIRKILEVVKKCKGSAFPESELFTMYRNHPLDFYETVEDNWDNLNFYDFDFVMYLIYDLPKNFRKNDIDHIHPKSILAKKGIDWGKINNIANYQLLDYANNRGSKNDKEFGEWFNSCVTDISSYLTLHLIPNENKLWKSDNFDNFLEERKTLIICKIKENIV